ncbi:MAG: lipopolysaccharide kinase InaA family protein [Syntrophotaleaceae bacterium]
MVKERHSRYIVHRTGDAAAGVVLDRMLTDSEELFRCGQAVDSGRPGERRDCLQVDIAGQSCFIKRYNCLGWRYRLGHLLRPSRALRSGGRAGCCCRQGADSHPRLCLEERTFRLLGRAYLVCAGLTDAVQLLELWPQLAIAEQQEALTRLAELIGRMHRRRIIHGDINWRNILVRQETEQRPITLSILTAAAESGI